MALYSVYIILQRNQSKIAKTCHSPAFDKTLSLEALVMLCVMSETQQYSRRGKKSDQVTALPWPCTITILLTLFCLAPSSLSLWPARPLLLPACPFFLSIFLLLLPALCSRLSTCLLFLPVPHSHLSAYLLLLSTLTLTTRFLFHHTSLYDVLDPSYKKSALMEDEFSGFFFVFHSHPLIHT